MDALENQKHERFCQNVSKGESDLKSYQKAFKCTRKCAITNAWRMREIQGIENRIRYLQNKTATETVMDMRERRLFFARTKRLDLTKFDPKQDGDLVEEIQLIDGKKRYKIASKSSCIVNDARLAGELIDKRDLTSDGQALPSAMPTIEMRLPVSFLTRRAGKN